MRVKRNQGDNKKIQGVSIIDKANPGESIIVNKRSGESKVVKKINKWSSKKGIESRDIQNESKAQ